MRMKRIVCLLVTAVFLLTAGLVWAQEKRASAAMAKIWVEKAEKYVKDNGLKAAIDEFNKPAGPFIKDDLYISVISFDGKMVAFPKDHSKIGADRMNLKDPDGKMFIKEMINLAKTKGAGWVDYKYIHPTTKKTEQKTTYVKKIADNMLLACGAYK